MNRSNKFFGGLAILILIIGIVSADIGDYGICGMWGFMYGDYGFGMSFFGWFFMILTSIALIVFIFWMFSQIQKNSDISKRK